jgi:hypothetical protein
LKATGISLVWPAPLRATSADWQAAA